LSTKVISKRSTSIEAAETQDSALADQIQSLSLLNDPVRRSLFLLTRFHAEPVSRDQAAAELNISRWLAAFHLDKLAEAGLVKVSYRRTSGRTGPGAGRPAKFYAPTNKRLAVAVPPRNYELLARLQIALLKDVARDQTRAVEAGAKAFGRALGSQARATLDAGADRRRRMDALKRELESLGYEPIVERSGALMLRNCPFVDLAQENTELVCGMNLGLLEGVLAGLEISDVQARPDQRDDTCCVAFESARTARPRGSPQTVWHAAGPTVKRTRRST
jgi:predicted ArsR family transcriptional regulator